MAVVSVRPPVVVIGAGITGLAAAHRLVERGRAGEAIPPILVLEGTGRVGGQVRTERVGDLLLEGGADTIVAQKPAAVRLCERLGLGPELEDLSARHGGTEILWKGRLHRVPQGFVMMAPTRLGPVLGSSLFTWPGKIRMALEPFIRERPDGIDDESLASFVTRRFGREALLRAAEPIAASIFTADADQLSLRLTMPRFLDLERRHGSVRSGLATAVTMNHAPASARPGAFVTLRRGLSHLVETLVAALPEGSVRTGTRVAAVTRAAASETLTLRLENGETIEAVAVLLACPAFECARLLKRQDGTLASTLDALAYASCATVSLVYRRPAVTSSLRSFGFFVPRVLDLPILACSFVSEKFPSRAPAEFVVFRVFLGGATRPEILDRSDAALERIAHDTLRPVLRINEDPVAAHTCRFPRAMPQFAVGDSTWLAEVARGVASIPGLAIAGSAAGAVGIPDGIRSGEEAADRLRISLGSPAWVANHANQYA